MKFYGIDFFCGIGGTTKGLQKAGIEVIKGIDNDSNCEETYNKNCKPSKFLLKDIDELETKEVLDGFVRKKEDVLIFSASAPCQPFSRQNPCSVLDDRANLIHALANFIDDIVPDVIFIENVLGIVKAANGSILNNFLKFLKSDGLNYEYEWKKVDARKYGIPQKRVRFILIASRLGKIPFPEMKYGKDKLPYATVRDTIYDYPPIIAGEEHSKISNHDARNLSELNLKRMRCTPKNGGSRKDWPKDLWLKCHLGEHTGHQDVYGRMKWDKPAPTLTCKCNSLSNGRFGHPEQDRAISLREAAALQTFDDDFIFYGESKCNIAQQIGNAVPPKIAEIFGKQIITYCKLPIKKEKMITNVAGGIQ